MASIAAVVAVPGVPGMGETPGFGSGVGGWGCEGRFGGSSG
ncbi:MAG: hypothetical protein WBW49_15605 [Candidatus Acidiferrum sp.]